MSEAVDGTLRGTSGPEGHGAIIDNRTTLPDSVVQEAIMAQWTEVAGAQLATPTTFQLYATQGGGSMLSRQPFRTPGNVFDEIRLARQMADTDDDIVSAIGQAIATAFGDGMENQHQDEKTLRLFNEVASGKVMNLDLALKEIYREYLIAGQFTTISLFTRRRLSFTPGGTSQKVNAQLAVPLVGVLPSENIRVLSTDLFNNGELAYKTDDNALRQWLDEFFSPRTTEARRAAMRRDQPVLAALFTKRVEVPYNDSDMFIQGQVLYGLNPRMVHRTTMPKGAAAYPRPLLTSNFALLEAKRLLNIMDYSLLQGGTNYIVVAKQGSDALPAQQPEIDNLTEQVRHASRTGILVGDHRISIDIITPDLSELLNASKRMLIGRKLAMALLRIPEQVTSDADVAAEQTNTANTITSDRRDIKRHIEGFIYSEVVERNPTAFAQGSPSLWFPKIILSGIKDFYDSVVKARDRGDIPRKWAVELLGYDYEAGVAQRERERENGDDETMVPGSVPFSTNDGTPPQDNGPGRPPGSSRNNGRPGSPDQNTDPNPSARPRLVQRRRGGEPIRASFSEEAQEVVRFGEVTAAVVEQFPGHTVGRVTDVEREAVASGEVYQRGPVAVVPLNPAYEVTELRALRLDDGLGLIVGRTRAGAIVAKGLSTREPHYSSEDAIDRALRWGFIAAVQDDGPALAELAGAAPPTFMESVAQAVSGMDPTTVEMIGKVVGQLMAKQPIVVNLPGEGEVEFVRDEETGAIIGKRPVTR
jgi:hypothetical protein